MLVCWSVDRPESQGVCSAPLGFRSAVSASESSDAPNLARLWELTVILHVMPVRAFGVRPHCWVMDAQPGMSTGFWVHRICLDTQCILVPTQPALLKLHSLDPLTDETEGALLSG